MSVVGIVRYARSNKPALSTWISWILSSNPIYTIKPLLIDIY
jgi:hypothetical protein